MEFDKLETPIDSSWSCVLHLPTSVIYGMLFAAYENFTYKGSPHQPFFLSENYRMNDLSCVIRMWAQVSFVLSQSTRLTDGQSHGRTDRKAFAIPCVAFHAGAR